MTQRQHFFGAAVAVLLGLCAACTDSSGPAKTPANDIPALLVSSPVNGASGNSTVGGQVTYVSLPPGSVPDGERANIRDLASGDSVVVMVVDGGFDPISIGANAGDTLTVVITRAGSAPPVTASQVVSATRFPSVVRTAPPRGKRDVPINAVIVVVFSAPIDPATVNAASIQLMLGGTPVAGSLQFTDGSDTRLQFHPSSLLRVLSIYELTVSSSIRDLNGVPLSETVSTDFITGTEVSSPASITIDPSEIGLIPDPKWHPFAGLTATVRDSAGNALDVPVRWTSSDTTVATVDVNGGVSSRTTGTAVVNASYAVPLKDPVVGTAQVTVLPELDTVRFSPASLSLVVGQRIKISAVGADRANRPVDLRQFFTSWTCTDRSGDPCKTAGTIAMTQIAADTILVTATGVGRGWFEMCVGWMPEIEDLGWCVFNDGLAVTFTVTDSSSAAGVRASP